MKLVRPLSIKGAVLDKYQLESYMEKIASDHVLQEKSDKKTYPIPRLTDNFVYITNTYEMLNKHLKMGITIHPAGEWLLDNYYIIEEVVKSVKKELTPKKYTNFLGISNGMYKGYARVYVLAAEIVAYTDSKIDSKTLTNLLIAYQKKKTLNMEEIWNINVFFNIAIVENIRDICERIVRSGMQKYKVENIIERLVEKKNKNERVFSLTPEYKKTNLLGGQIKYPFIEYMSYRLKQYGNIAMSFIDALEEQVNKMGTNVSEVIKKEHFDIAIAKVSIGNCIKSIKDLQRINFLEIFENINGVEEILRKDPANTYEKMDLKTKEYYRNKIKEISEKTKISEIYIANKILELATREFKDSKFKEKKAHIGYYLISDGYKELMEILEPDKKTKKSSLLLYILNINMISAFLSFFTGLYMYIQTINIVLSIISIVLIFIPISEMVTKITQYIMSKTVKPKLIPKLDLSKRNFKRRCYNSCHPHNSKRCEKG